MLLLLEGVLLQFCRIITSIAVCIILLVTVAQADQEKSTQGFSETAGKLLAIVAQMQAPLPTSASPQELRAQLIQRIEGWRVCPLLLEERLCSRENRLKNGKATARARHQEFAEFLVSVSKIYIVDVSAGQMHISSMARRLLEKHYSGTGEVKSVKTQSC